MCLSPLPGDSVVSMGQVSLMSSQVPLVPGSWESQGIDSKLGGGSSCL